MGVEWETWLARGRAVLGAPPLSRGEKVKRGLEDPKWALGDLVREVPDHLLDAFVRDLRTDKPLRQYHDVAAKWPREHRVAASWTAHRELKDNSARFDLIRPGMTMRRAAEAAGKKPLDAKPRERMSVEERVAEAIALLSNKAVNDLVLKRLVEQRGERRKLKAARAAAEELSAEYREAQRNLRAAQAAKSPERAVLEAIFRMRETAEYLRAVVEAATDPEAPLVPEHRKPDLLNAIHTLAEATATALSALSGGTDGGVVIDVTPANTSPTAKLLESTVVSDSD